MSNFSVLMITGLLSAHMVLWCQPPNPNTDAFSFCTTDAHTENKEELIEQVLALQSALIVESRKVDRPLELLQENGFLTVRMTPEELMNELLDGGVLFTAHSQHELVGYLLLTESHGYFSWLRSVDRVELHSQWSIDELERYYRDHDIKILHQIAVATSYAKQGIGTQLVMQAKQFAPHGLSTDILYQPFTNHASLAFFAKQGFKHIGTVYTLGNPPRSLPHEIYMELWEP